MQSKLAPHWQYSHQGQRDWRYFSEWRPYVSKIVFNSDEDIPALDLLLNTSQKVVARWHIVSENWEQRGIQDVAQALEMGDNHASALIGLWNKVRQKHNVQPERILWEGLNEPQVGGSEPPHLTSKYFARFSKRMHVAGLNVVVGNFSVGWPGNGGIVDAPPNWKPFQEIRDGMNDSDWLGLREYWDHRGPGFMWPWWAGAYTKCPWQVPIFIGECGLDAAVSNWEAGHFGFHGLSPDMNEAVRLYMDMLKWYDERLFLDPRVVAATPFTYDFNHPWSTFNIRVDPMMRQLLEYISIVGVFVFSGIPTSTPPPPPEIWGNAQISQWQDLSEKWGAATNIDAKIIGTLIKIESDGNKYAISSVGATGLMQVVPNNKIFDESGADLFPNRPSQQALFDPDTNIEWGAKILKDGLTVYGDLTRALANYYGGPWLADHLGDDYAVEYLSEFEKEWANLWDEPSPLTELDVTDARWYSEQVTREIEGAIETLSNARKMQIMNVTSPLYDIEGVR